MTMNTGLVGDDVVGGLNRRRQP